MLTFSSKIDGIEGQLRSLGGVPGQQQFIDQIQVNEGTPRLLEDMQEAILNYQVRSRPITFPSFDGADKGGRWRSR